MIPVKLKFLERHQPVHNQNVDSFTCEWDLWQVIPGELLDSLLFIELIEQTELLREPSEVEQPYDPPGDSGYKNAAGVFVSNISSSDALGKTFGYFVAFTILSMASCKWPNSCIISNSSFTTGCNKLTNVQNRVRSSIMAARSERRSTSSKSDLRCEISCIDDSTKLCMESDWPFFAFFCSRKVSVERFFNSDRHRLYSLACSLSIRLAWRFQSSTLSYECDPKFI